MRLPARRMIMECHHACKERLLVISNSPYLSFDLERDLLLLLCFLSRSLSRLEWTTAVLGSLASLSLNAFTMDDKRLCHAAAGRKDEEANLS